MEPSDDRPWKRSADNRQYQDVQHNGRLYRRWRDDPNRLVLIGQQESTSLQASIPRRPAGSVLFDRDDAGRAGLTPPQPESQNYEYRGTSREGRGTQQLSRHDDDRDTSYRDRESADQGRDVPPRPTSHPAAMGPPAPVQESASFLSTLAQRFAQIEIDDFTGFEKLLQAYPHILKEDPNLFQREAMRLHRQGQLGLARCCVQTLLLLRVCDGSTGEEIKDFFRRLRSPNSSDVDLFRRDLDKTVGALSAQSSGVPSLEPARNTMGASPDIRQLRIEERPQGPSTEDRPGNDPDRRDTRPPGNDRTSAPPAPVSRRRETRSSQDDESHLTIGSSDITPTAPPDFKGIDQNLDPREAKYYKRRNAKKFFEPGRVFALWWPSPASDNTPVGGRSNGRNFRDNKRRGGNRDFFGEVQRFAVSVKRRGYCICVPIKTYGGQGVARPNLPPEEVRRHAVIHMSDTNPSISREEQGLMTKKPIAVVKAQGEKLDPMSRIHFGKPFTVEWNVQVRNVGKVSPASMVDFETYCDTESRRGEA